MSRDDERAEGALALVLHSHMPYVEGFGTWPFGEEWLWEAAASVYVPLLDVLDGAPVTLGLTPVLCDQLETLPGAPGRRLHAFLRDTRAAVHAEDAAGLQADGQTAAAAELRRAAGDYEAADRRLEALGDDLLGALAALAGVELMTSAATHAILPMLATRGGARLQVGAGVAAHRRRFGGFGGTFWSPECAYGPGLEGLLVEHGVERFCVDQTEAHGLGAAEQLEPVATRSGPVAVPVDWQTVALVWSSEGYPAHAAYRDSHRRTVHDLMPWSNGGRPYDAAAARRQAAAHARDFVAHVEARLARHRAERGRAGLLCCALDTELLGHWWYEGPAWLEAVLAGARERGLRLVTLSEAAEVAAPVERPLAPSSWGTPKDLTTWDAPDVADLAFAARRRELAVVLAAGRAGGSRPAALVRAARELLALQSSDWAFMASRGLAGPYPRERAQAHAARADEALAALAHSAPGPEPALRNLAPELDVSPLLSP